MERFENKNEDVNSLIEEYADLLFKDESGELDKMNPEKIKLALYDQKYGHYRKRAQERLIEKYKQN